MGKYFLSCSGFDLEHGIFENHEMEAQVKRKFLKVTDEVILMADHAQFGRKSLTSLTGLAQVDKLIVDHGLPIDNLTSLRSAGVNIVLAN
ncbi:hypothetical protein ABU162_01400 [Paenibacillus thiaminolyticus]|uniref:hypothetical protein n=1 Tax=Paenibacillus thiaminolyticus TaxID=49283 RepID=UPI0035A5BECD